MDFRVEGRSRRRARSSRQINRVVAEMLDHAARLADGSPCSPRPGVVPCAATFYSLHCLRLALLRLRPRVHQVRRVTVLRGRPPAYRIDTVCKEGDGAIPGTVNSRLAASVWQPHLGLTPAAAGTRDTRLRDRDKASDNSLGTMACP
ncbi:hypothetical protein BRAS3843_620027 [Bradyrhizobium sp. STM 3843]|nr:hypothetical protein BRAS3843_620027 [Bradyrhizobium sp. STM 3843]